ncbi:MAG: 3-methyladenine DNA glycosylase, partial [Nocardioides sp.]
MPVETLPLARWLGRAEAHAARLAPYVEPHLARRRRGESHPVHDFLFSYYSQRPAQLLRWHPGFGTRLLDAPAYDELSAYADGTVTRDHLESRRPLLEAT